jgi:hypothetical protein
MLGNVKILFKKFNKDFRMLKLELKSSSRFCKCENLTSNVLQRFCKCENLTKIVYKGFVNVKT